MFRLPKPRSALRRWMVFNSVGGLGIIVQMSTLMLFIHGFRLNYLQATGIAVEAAVLHNFFWHEHWTWVERTRVSRHSTFQRLVYFHLTNGIVSLGGNLILMRLFIGSLKWGYVQADAMAIAACSIANFLAGDLLVFRKDT